MVIEVLQVVEFGMSIDGDFFGDCQFGSFLYFVWIVVVEIVGYVCIGDDVEYCCVIVYVLCVEGFIEIGIQVDSQVYVLVFIVEVLLLVMMLLMRLQESRFGMLWGLWISGLV